MQNSWLTWVAGLVPLLQFFLSQWGRWPIRRSPSLVSGVVQSRRTYARRRDALIDQLKSCDDQVVREQLRTEFIDVTNRIMAIDSFKAMSGGSPWRNILYGVLLFFGSEFFEYVWTSGASASLWPYWIFRWLLFGFALTELCSGVGKFTIRSETLKMLLLAIEKGHKQEAIEKPHWVVDRFYEYCEEESLRKAPNAQGYWAQVKALRTRRKVCSRSRTRVIGRLSTILLLPLNVRGFDKLTIDPDIWTEPSNLPEEYYNWFCGTD